jgi:hypothetical protein
MAENPKTASYAKMAAEAEAAVAAMTDPELRRVAFEKILSTLLEGDESSSRVPERRSESEDAKRPGRSRTNRSVSQSRQGPKAYVESLIEEDFFKKQRTIAEVKAELANRGRHIALTSLSGPLQKLTQERRLRRQKITANGKGTKTTYGYSNW